MIPLSNSSDLVSQLADSGLIRPKAPGMGSQPYAIDTRDAVSSVFRGVAIAAIDQWFCEVGNHRLAAVASSGSVLAALWAGRHNEPFWNVLVHGRRTRGLRRAIEPDDNLAGHTFVLLDNHRRTGESLSTAQHMLEDHGATVVAFGVFTASDDDGSDLPLHVFLPHGEIMERFSAS